MQLNLNITGSHHCKESWDFNRQMQQKAVSQDSKRGKHRACSWPRRRERRGVEGGRVEMGVEDQGGSECGCELHSKCREEFLGEVTSAICGTCG